MEFKRDEAFIVERFRSSLTELIRDVMFCSAPCELETIIGVD